MIYLFFLCFYGHFAYLHTLRYLFPVRMVLFWLLLFIQLPRVSTISFLYSVHSSSSLPLTPSVLGHILTTRFGICIHTQEHFSATPPLFQKPPVSVTQVFKGVFMVLMTNVQSYCLTDRRNTLRNPSCTFCGLGK